MAKLTYNGYTPIKLAGIKAGAFFIEEDWGFRAGFRALEDARVINQDGFRNGYTLKGEVVDPDGNLKIGQVIEFFESFDAGAYGLKLYEAVEKE